MMRIFGILLILLGVWVGISIYTEGIDHAMYGIFAPLASSSGSNAADTTSAPGPTGVRPAAPQTGPITQRVRNRVNAIYRQEQRQLEERTRER